jgi:putative aldouronate transport system permease protein
MTSARPDSRSPASPAGFAGSPDRQHVSTGKMQRLSKAIWRERWMYVFILPGFFYFVVFRYLPLAGNVIAFQQYSPFLGLSGSPWVGMDNFRRLFTDPDIPIVLRNTLVISLAQLVLFFPVPIAVALLLNSILNDRIKRLMQSILYLPHFISWVIIIALWQQLFGGAGMLNQILGQWNIGPLNIMSNPDFFKPLVVIQVIWKETGWGTILFLAALTKIDPQLYEAAVIDGASGWRRLRDITLPGIRPMIVLLLILRLGSILDTGFEQIFLQRNAVGFDAGEVLDTFVYYRGIQGGDLSFATAVGLVKGVIGAILIFSANRFAKKMGEEGVF